VTARNRGVVDEHIQAGARGEDLLGGRVDARVVGDAEALALLGAIGLQSFSD
jgi:hypothetical protein